MKSLVRQDLFGVETLLSERQIATERPMTEVDCPKVKHIPPPSGPAGSCNSDQQS